MNKTIELTAPVEQVWTLFRDVDRFAKLVPGVMEVQIGESNGDQESYVARVADKVGPFRLEMRLEIKVVQMVDEKLLQANLSGLDSGGKNRLKGMLRAELIALEPRGTRVEFSTDIEVLGKLAALGASPIRRRTEERFSQFAGRIAEQFSL